MPGRCLHEQASAAVERQIRLGKHDGVDGVVVDVHVFAAVCKRVFRVFCQGHKDLVGFKGVDRGRCAANDLRALQDDLNLVLLPGVHDDLSILKRAAEDIHAFVEQDDLRAVDGDGVRVAAGAAAVKADGYGAALVVAGGGQL